MCLFGSVRKMCVRVINLSIKYKLNDFYNFILENYYLSSLNNLE